MDCLRSFNINLELQRGFSTAATNVKNWGVVGNYHWQVIENTLPSDFIVEGFKRIDLYGIQMVGSVFTSLDANDGAIVSDYGMRIGITGQSPLASGIAQSTGWPLYTNMNAFQLSRYSNEVTFESPLAGVTNINFGQFNAQGNNGETLNSITLEIKLAFVFYYKYDGE
jgi:hypothetical protein